MNLRIWWIPQIPLQDGADPFRVTVESVDEGAKILEVLAEYDKYQFETSVKPDYCNAGGLEMLENDDWTDWEDEETGEDDPIVYAAGVLVEEQVERKTPTLNEDGYHDEYFSFNNLKKFIEMLDGGGDPADPRAVETLEGLSDITAVVIRREEAVDADMVIASDAAVVGITYDSASDELCFMTQWADEDDS